MLLGVFGLSLAFLNGLVVWSLLKRKSWAGAYGTIIGAVHIILQLIGIAGGYYTNIGIVVSVIFIALMGLYFINKTDSRKWLRGN